MAEPPVRTPANNNEGPPSATGPTGAQPRSRAITRVPAPAGRGSGPFATPKHRRRYWFAFGALALAALFFAGALLWYGNPMPVDDPAFWLIAERRATSVFVMLVVAICQGLATVAFQTVTNNRILTPSIMGFESLYMVIQTGTLFFFGATALIGFRGLWQFSLQVALMMALALLLYTWLLSGRFANLQIMLLVGIIIGGGLGSVSTFMQRLLTPSDFDLLTARMFGSVNNADPSTFPVAIPIVVVAAALLVLRSRRLNAIALGRDIAVNLGISHKRELIINLTLISALMAVSTSLVGPLTFLGFLVATLAYQLAPTYDHRYVFPMAALTGFVVLTGAYFIMNHVFYAQGVVGIIIELVGGLAFLVVILKRGRL
ncbi:ABC-type cobalamin/Fe3+-siderophore transport system, permease [Pseudoclavibacter endophyticus]|uniref:Iron chelate uptake ABC transporter family permease subunit n=1 Tax=Pseudoclavibacter endophyticus TaxID=1778590 RepID=A0A6H9WGR0_9MICO|nr:iron chelate uptake ABC transporter family permease subunit [Pseudoclavibacter endophyticus]KAB1650112.1 iron chelate uptake ABC transporter family permease subunit [Pseudoclavibacter endophyticus]GGA57138.1 ABC-type cobalamin/Fe3+-siderophore transport system, permease [Pseudoclavibacter endophyticus]